MTAAVPGCRRRLARCPLGNHQVGGRFLAGGSFDQLHAALFHRFIVSRFTVFFSGFRWDVLLGEDVGVTGQTMVSCVFVCVCG